MQMLNLSRQKLQDLLPYIDTLIFPVGVLNVPNGDDEFVGSDLLEVKQAALWVDQQLTGRVFIMPDVVHTNLGNLGQIGMTCDLLGNYLYETVMPLKQIGFIKAVFLYGKHTNPKAIESAATRLKEEGVHILSYNVHPQEDEGNAEIPSAETKKVIVQKIVELWR